jgi:hypothetical protein
MTRKGKFQILSYLIDENLIYYKSLNKNKKIVAFAMFETVFINPIISTLNNFLRKRFIQYYTIQWNSLEKNKKVFLLNFEEEKKESIIKIFNEVGQKLRRVNDTLIFFKNSQLEWKFLEPILKESSSKVSLMKQSNSILVLNRNDSFLLNMYNVDLDYLENLEFFFYNFLKILNSFNKEGYLLFTFRIDHNDEITFSPFYTEKCNKEDDLFNTEKSINTFFNYTMLKRHDTKIKQIFNCLWRLGISDDSFSLKYFNKLFLKEEKNGITKLLKFNKGFEQNLSQNQIKFIRLGKKLLLIEEKYLFVVLTKLNSEYIQKIIEKYHSKYFIYITILSESEIKKLLNISKFNCLRNLQILTTKEILDFNFNLFRNNN